MSRLKRTFQDERDDKQLKRKNLVSFSFAHDQQNRFIQSQCPMPSILFLIINCYIVIIVIVVVIAMIIFIMIMIIIIIMEARNLISTKATTRENRR